MNTRRWVLSVLSFVLGWLFIGQIALCFVAYNSARIPLFLWLGWATFAVILVLTSASRQAFVAEGNATQENWLRTTRVVESGIYGIIRHPQYTGIMLLIVALMLITQHWLSVVFGMPSIAFLYYLMVLEERSNVEKFGDDYRRYLERVPRLNVVVGVLRQVRRRKAKKTSEA